MQRSLSRAIANFLYSSNFCEGEPTGFVHCATEVGPGTLSSATLGQESSNLTFSIGIGEDMSVCILSLWENLGRHPGGNHSQSIGARPV